MKISRKERITQLLTRCFAPSHLSIEDESYQHHVPQGAETHFMIVLVSDLFLGQNRIARHRMIHEQLKNEFDTGLHALSLRLYTPNEWSQMASINPSPKCRGGFDKGEEL